MIYLNERSYLFRAPVRRARVARLVCALAALTVVNVVTVNAGGVAVDSAAASVQDDAFDKLGSRSEGQSLAEDGTGRFSVIGGGDVFEFSREGRRATIKFLCRPSPKCSDEMRKLHTLTGEPTGRGDMVFKSADSVPVLRVTATGGATLFGGAPFVPASVPRTGRAVVPTK